MIKRAVCASEGTSEWPSCQRNVSITLYRLILANVERVLADHISSKETENGLFESFFDDLKRFFNWGTWLLEFIGISWEEIGDNKKHQGGEKKNETEIGVEIESEIESEILSDIVSEIGSSLFLERTWFRFVSARKNRYSDFLRFQRPKSKQTSKLNDKNQLANK